MEIKERVIQWAESGGDFSAGISLFLSWNRNVFYARNIELKGTERGMITLLSEFSSKTKIPVKDILVLISTAQENPATQSDSVGPSHPNILETSAEEKNLLLARKNETIKRTTKLREEFPFLASKDCPDELAILVNKMLNSYDEYRLKRQELFQTDFKDAKECYRAARAVLDPYILNREIWEELNYYKIHGKILGKMPQFAARKMKEKYRAMRTAELVKISGNNIPRKMSYYKSQLRDEKTKNKEDIRAKMVHAEGELLAIREILLLRGEL